MVLITTLGKFEVSTAHLAATQDVEQNIRETQINLLVCNVKTSLFWL